MLALISGNALLMLLKLTAGYWGGSSALIADGLHSAADAAASVVVLLSIRLSLRPPDREHPYGHGKVESIASGLTALFLVAVALEIMLSAIWAILAGSHSMPSILTAIAALISIAANEMMFRVANTHGKRVGSQAMIANSWDNRSDTLSSTAALAGIIGARLGFPVLDHVAAIIVSIMIMRVVYHLMRDAAHELMDRMVDDVGDDIVAIAKRVDGVEHAYARVRRVGRGVVVDLKLEMDPRLTLSGSHDIGISVKRRILNRLKSVTDVMIHIHPHDE